MLYYHIEEVLGQGKIFRIVPGDGDASTLSSSPTEETISTGEGENDQEGQEGQDPIVEGQEEEGQPQEDVDGEEEDSNEERQE